MFTFCWSLSIARMRCYCRLFVAARALLFLYLLFQLDELPAELAQ